MEAARQGLAARIATARQRIHELDRRVEEARARFGATDDGDSTQRQAEFARQWVLAHELTPEWRLVLDRIDRGELSWRDIVLSQRAMRMDPDVRRAYRSLDAVPTLSPERYQQILDSVAAQFDPPTPAT